MDIKQLKFLIALDQTRHFGQAAALCHITQPTLSMRLRNLEDELDLVLVTRGQRFEGFTEAGERVLAWARSLLAAHDGLYAEAAACRGQLVGTLRVGVVPLAGFDPMRLVELFAQRHPELRFQIHSLSTEQILEGLGRNQLDLGLSYLDRLDREHFDSIELAETHLGLLHDRRHFPLEVERLSWELLADLRLGLPRLDDSAVEQWTPQQIGLDRLAAYSVTKGCYPGQEIVARTHFLGKAKRVAQLVQVPAGTVAGAELHNGGQHVGSVASVAGELALAVLPVDSDGLALQLGDTPAPLQPLLAGLAR